MTHAFQPAWWLAKARKVFLCLNFCIALLAGMPSNVARAGDVSIKDLTEFLGATIIGGLAVSRPLAGGKLSIETRGSQTLEINDNISREVDSSGAVAIRSSTNVRGAIKSVERLREYSVESNLGWTKTRGPGAPDNLDSQNRRYLARFRHSGKSVTVNARAIRSIRNAAEAQLDDTTVIPLLDAAGEPIVNPATQTQSTGDTNVDGVQESFALGGDISIDLNHRNSLKFTANGSQQAFSGDTPGLVDSRVVNTAAAWTYLMTRKTSLTGDFSRLVQKPSEGGQTTKREVRGAIATQITRKLNVRTSLGAAFVEGNQAATDGQNPIAASGSTVGFVGDLGLRYAMKRTDLNFKVSRNVSPTSTGELQTVDSTSVSLRHNINHRAKAGIIAAFSKQTSPAPSSGLLTATGDGGRTLFRISPTYSIIINRKWIADMKYDYTRQKNTAGVAESNALFFTFSRSLPVGQ